MSGSRGRVINWDGSMRMCVLFKKKHRLKKEWLRLCLLLVSLFPIFVFSQGQAHQREWNKICYVLQADAVVSTGKYAPFWLVSNRHGLSSLENNNANLSLGFFRNFDQKKGFAWAYGAEVAGAYNHYAPFYIQQLYADVKYNCWELSIGSKERRSEGKNPKLSGGGLTFAPNSRPIPQIRFGINEYTTVPWWFNGWVKVKGHFSYGRYTDDRFQRNFTNGALGSHYTTNLLFHEKTAFLRIVHPSGKGLGWESGLEMYTKFGGNLYVQGKYQQTFPTSYLEYIKAFIPMPGGRDAPDEERVNVNGNVLGSWHAIMDYTAESWKLRAYYEHFFEDHSQMLGISWVPNREGEIRFLSYHPWLDGMWGLELELLNVKWLRGVVAEYITSRDQSGPILHNANANFKEQISGFDYYYNHYYFQSWQHWGMAICNPHFLSPTYNENGSLSMPNTRIRSYHIGIDGLPFKEWKYRLMSSYTRHWGSFYDYLPNPGFVVSSMFEMTYIPSKLKGWYFTGSVSFDCSNLLGDNFGGMVVIKKTGLLTK